MKNSELLSVNDLAIHIKKIADIQNSVEYYKERQKNAIESYQSLSQLAYCIGSESIELKKIQKQLDELRIGLQNCHSNISLNVDRLIKGEKI